MFTSHIFVILAIFLLLKCNEETEAPSPSASGAVTTAAKVQRSQTMRASSRSASPRSRTSSPSTSSASSATSQKMRESALKEVDLQPLIDTVRSEATAQTFSGGRIDPSVQGVQTRIRSAILRHSSRFFAGVGVGTGLIATGKLISINFNNATITTTTTKAPTTTILPSTTTKATITTTTDADDIVDNI